MTRSHKVIAANIRINEHLNGLGPILSTDTGANPVPRMPVNTHRKRRTAQAGIACRLCMQVQAITGGAIKAYAQIPAPDAGQKVHHLRRHKFRSNNKVAFVLTVFVVHKNDRLTGAEVCKNFGDRAKRHRVNRLGEAGARDGNTIQRPHDHANP